MLAIVNEISNINVTFKALRWEKHLGALAFIVVYIENVKYILDKYILS